MLRTLFALLGWTLPIGAQGSLPTIQPPPSHLEVVPGEPIPVGSITYGPADFAPQVTALAESLRRLGISAARVGKDPRAESSALFLGDPSMPPEAYAIETLKGTLYVRASTPIGAAHACATLLQAAKIEDSAATWPRLRVDDAPRFPFRSFMVDMGRNPHSPETLRHLIDAMGFYKLNYLQLHLTDDQLFSWPSKAYPKLYSPRAGWTLQDFADLEAYSQARGVTIVPELEVPGHSGILRGKYPEVFGSTTTELATFPSAKKGIETLLDELLEVFPSSPYVHIGGDEAYGVPEEHQRDLINHLNRFLRERGKRTLVWEGPRLGTGDNKVDEDVIHLNWRTINFPAQDMLDAGYPVVNAAWDPLYIVDHYPKTMFTAVEVARCYDWDPRRFAHINHGIPTFSNPHRTEASEGILGFCMPWWEGREENLLPLCVPRLAAVGCAAWNPGGRVAFERFQVDQRALLPRLERISGFELPTTPFADPATQTDNLAYRAHVTPSAGASQPHFGPERLTNGIPDRFDHFLGFPTQPEPLEIRIELLAPAEVSRIVIHERAIGVSHEIYDLLVSSNGESFTQVGTSTQGTRGDRTFVEHTFDPQPVSTILIRTQGCHGLTFPSFSRLSEVMAFSE